MPKMITRTILATKATVITVDTATMQAEQKDYTIGGEWTDNNKLLKALKKTYEEDTTVISAVIKTEKVEKLFGMTEEFFIAHAVELDAETRKPLTTTGVNPSNTAVADNSTIEATVEAPANDAKVSAKAEKISIKNKNK